MISIGIICALIAMLCWGVSDFLQSIVIRKLGPLKTMYASNLLGLIITFVIALYYFVFLGKIEITLPQLIILCICGVVLSLAVNFFMQSFKIGEVSVVAPISASYPVVTVALAILFLNEKLSIVKIISIAVIIIGIVLTSTDLRKLKHLRTVKGVKESIIALVMWGIYYVPIGLLSKQIEYFNFFIFTSLTSGMLMVAYPAMKKEYIRFHDLKDKKIIMILLFNAVSYTVAWFAMSYGLRQDLISIVTAVSSLYPAITVMLAVLIYKEKLVTNQKFGIIAVLAGIFLISF